MQVIAQRYGRREEGFKRRLFTDLGRRALVARVQVIVEVRSEIDFIEGIRFLYRGNVRGGGKGRVGGRSDSSIERSAEDTAGGRSATRHDGRFKVGFRAFKFRRSSGHVQDGLIGGFS